MILTDEEIGKTIGCLNMALDAEIPMLISECIRDARAIEAKVLKKVRKQILEEVCFKMASGSPNRARIHAVLETWK